MNLAAAASTDMVFARLQLAAPEALTYLVSACRPCTQTEALATQLAASFQRAGLPIRLLRLVGPDLQKQDAIEGAAGNITVKSVPLAQLNSITGARALLCLPDVRTIALGAGLLTDPGTLLAAVAVDGVLVVVRQGRTARSDLATARTELERAGARILGAMLAS